jgi:hypothetical protein
LRLLGGAAGDPPTPRRRLVLHSRRLQVSSRRPMSILFYLFAWTYTFSSSVTESLTRGIPLIVWPAGAEQPVNAAFLSTGPNPVAIELFQVGAPFALIMA